MDMDYVCLHGRPYHMETHGGPFDSHYFPRIMHFNLARLCMIWSILFIVYFIRSILYGAYTRYYLAYSSLTTYKTAEVFEMRDRKILKKLQDTIHETQKVFDAKISRAQSGESIKKRLKSFSLESKL